MTDSTAVSGAESSDLNLKRPHQKGGGKRASAQFAGPLLAQPDASNSFPFGPSLERGSSLLERGSTSVDRASTSSMSSVKSRTSSSSVVGQKAAFFEAQIKVADNQKPSDAVAAKLNRFKSLPTTIRIPREEPRSRQQSAREAYEQHIREKMRLCMPPVLQARYFGTVQRGKHFRTSSIKTHLSSAENFASFPLTPTRTSSQSVSTPSSSFPSASSTNTNTNSSASSTNTNTNSSASSASVLKPFPSSVSSVPFPSSTNQRNFSASTSFSASLSRASASFPLPSPSSSSSSSFPSPSPSSSFPSNSNNKFNSISFPTPPSSSTTTLRPFFPNPVPLSPPARSASPFLPLTATSNATSTAGNAFNPPPPVESQSPIRRVRAPPMVRTWGSAAESKGGVVSGPATNPETFKELMAAKYRKSEGLLQVEVRDSLDAKQPSLIPASPIIVDKNPFPQKPAAGNTPTTAVTTTNTAAAMKELNLSDSKSSNNDKKSGDATSTASFAPVADAEIVPSSKNNDKAIQEVEKADWNDDIIVVSSSPAATSSSSLENGGETEKINVWDIDDVCIVDNSNGKEKEMSLLDKIKSVSVSEEQQRFAEYALLDFVVIRLPETKKVKGILRPPAEKRNGRSIEFDLKESEMPNCMFEQEEFEREEDEARKRQIEEEEEEDSGSPLDEEEAEPVPQFLIDDGEEEGDEDDEEEGDSEAESPKKINPLDAWKRAMEEKTLKLRGLSSAFSSSTTTTTTSTSAVAAADSTAQSSSSSNSSNMRAFRVAPRTWGVAARETSNEQQREDTGSSCLAVSTSNDYSSDNNNERSSFDFPASPQSETKEHEEELSSSEDDEEENETLKQETKQQRLARIKSKKKFMLDRAKNGGTITKGFGKNSVKMPDLKVTGESALEAWKSAMEEKTRLMKINQASRAAASSALLSSSSSTTSSDTTSSLLSSSSSTVAARDVDQTNPADVAPSPNAESGKRAFRVQPRAWRGAAAGIGDNSSAPDSSTTSANTTSSTTTSTTTTATSNITVTATSGASEDTFDAFSAWTKAMEEKTQRLKQNSQRNPPGPPPPGSKGEPSAATDIASETVAGQRKRPVARAWATASPSFFHNLPEATTSSSSSSIASSTSLTTAASSAEVANATLESPAVPTEEPKTPTRRMPRAQPRAWAGAAAAILADHKEVGETTSSAGSSDLNSKQRETTSSNDTGVISTNTLEPDVDAIANDPITPRRSRAKVQPRTWGTASASMLAQAQAQSVQTN